MSDSVWRFYLAQMRYDAFFSPFPFVNLPSYVSKRHHLSTSEYTGVNLPKFLDRSKNKINLLPSIPLKLCMAVLGYDLISQLSLHSLDLDLELNRACSGKISPPMIPISSALFRLFPSASLSVGHLGLNAVVMGGFEYFISFCNDLSFEHPKIDPMSKCLLPSFLNVQIYSKLGQWRRKWTKLSNGMKYYRVIQNYRQVIVS